MAVNENKTEEKTLPENSAEKTISTAKAVFMKDKTLKAGGYTLTKKQKFLREIFGWVETIVFAYLFALILTNFVVVNAQVPSESMQNTIMKGDRLFADRVSLYFSDPKRFDIVVFKYPDDPTQKTLYIKRIIGMPGDKITIKNNEIYINDSEEPLDDSFIAEPMVTFDAEYTVPEGCYFMMGDNRNNSADSRFWKVHTFVRRDQILGKAVLRYYPFDKMGKIE